MIPIAKPSIGKEEAAAVSVVLQSGMLAQGPRVRDFEGSFAKWLGVREAVAGSSGTAALIVSLLSHGIGPGDEVITTPFSFIASANSILFTGAVPVFVDVSENDFNINVDLIEAAITPRTKAILPVHLFGHPSRMNEISIIAKKHGLTIVEDACQAHGAKIDGVSVGTFGTSCFSFYPTKNMTTGEGGMIATNDSDVAVTARKLRDQGQKQRYQHDTLGYNWRMTDIAAAIGLVQLGKLESANMKRRENAKEFSSRITGVITPSEDYNYHHVFNQYTVRVPHGRDDMKTFLKEGGIGSEVYYPMPIHHQPVYRDLGYSDNLPVAEKLSKEVLSLPVYPQLNKEDIDAIVNRVNTFGGIENE